jgi:hypothetical protein
MHGIPAQWLQSALPDDWLDRDGHKAFEMIVRPWALGMAAQLSPPGSRTQPPVSPALKKTTDAATSDSDSGLAGPTRRPARRRGRAAR